MSKHKSDWFQNWFQKHENKNLCCLYHLFHCKMLSQSMDLHSIEGGVGILFALCYRNWIKLRPCVTRACVRLQLYLFNIGGTVRVSVKVFCLKVNVFLLSLWWCLSKHMIPVVWLYSIMHYHLRDIPSFLSELFSPFKTRQCWKKLEFQLALWTSNSQILLAPGSYIIIM